MVLESKSFRNMSKCLRYPPPKSSSSGGGLAFASLKILILFYKYP